MSPPALSPLLASTPILDAHQPIVMQTAHTVSAGAGTDVERARALFEWVRDAIPHVCDLGSQAMPCAASQVLTAGTGLCFAKAHLLAALCRAVRLPAGLCYQRCWADDEERFVLHGLNAVWLDSAGRWLRLDPRGNKAGVDAQFDLQTERLAFPVDPSRGECLYDGVFADPAPSVVDYLQRHPNLTAAWPALPAGLPAPELAAAVPM